MDDSANNNLPAASANEVPFPNPGGPPSTTPVVPNESSNETIESIADKGGGSRKRVFMLGITLFLMIGGIAAATFMLSNRGTFNRAVAWDCSLYKFEVSQSGAVTIENGSARNLPSQLATIYIDSQPVAEFEVSALDAGGGESIGVVPVPENGRFSWRVTGNKDCDQNGSFLPEASAECINIKAFDSEWNPLSVQDLAEFKPGDVVRFSVAGTTTQGSFQAARFTINSELRDPVTKIRPETDEFYDEYELPEDISSFGVTVELMHNETGWF